MEKNRENQLGLDATHKSEEGRKGLENRQRKWIGRRVRGDSIQKTVMHRKKNGGETDKRKTMTDDAKLYDRSWIWNAERRDRTVRGEVASPLTVRPLLSAFHIQLTFDIRTCFIRATEKKTKQVK